MAQTIPISTLKADLLPSTSVQGPPDELVTTRLGPRFDGQPDSLVQ